MGEREEKSWGKGGNRRVAIRRLREEPPARAIT